MSYMTRNEALDLAKEIAAEHANDHAYLDVDDFEPHEWVVIAVMIAGQQGYVDGYETGREDGLEEGREYND